MMASLSNSKHTILLLSLSVLANILLLFLWQTALHSKNALASFTKKYPYLSISVFLEIPNDSITNFLPLRDKIKKETESYKDDFAFYFNYLPTGTAIGINEDAQFTAASLLKVPVVMAYLHMKESEKIQQDKTITLKKSMLNDRFGDLYKKGEGYHLNLRDAIKLALQKSDNTASLALADQFTDDDFKFVYEGLDIPMVIRDDNPVITAEQYGAIFKALYYSSVLTTDNSEYILELLTKTDFNNMLVAGIPKNVPVSHKIGLIDKQIYEDCGIVYVPQRPYIVCVISKSDRKTAAARISKLSKMVYEYVVKLEE